MERNDTEDLEMEHIFMIQNKYHDGKRVKGNRDQSNTIQTKPFSTEASLLL